jgi:hypothetical protein
MSRNMDNLLDDLKTIRLVSYIEKDEEKKRGSLRINYVLEKADPDLMTIAEKLGVNNQNLKQKINVVVYN